MFGRAKFLFDFGLVIHVLVFYFTTSMSPKHFSCAGTTHQRCNSDPNDAANGAGL